jgi:hypothetical protein
MTLQSILYFILTDYGNKENILLAEPPQPEEKLHLGRLQQIPENLFLAQAKDLREFLHIAATLPNTSEEPCEGNLHARFREGEHAKRYCKRILRHESGNADTE